MVSIGTSPLPIPNRVPSRVRPYAVTQKIPALQRLLLGKKMRPTPQQYEEMKAALWHGDVAMDAVVEWLFAGSPKQAKAQFEQALEHGIASVQDAPEALREFFRQIDPDPVWLDRNLVEEGALFMRQAGTPALEIMRDLALMPGYLFSSFNHVLVLTGALSKGAGQRVAETAQWWLDCTEAGGMARDGKGFKSTLRVRLIHALVRRHIPSKPEWDSQQWGRPVNQIDLAATNLSFGPVFLLAALLCGIVTTPREAQAVLHFWKYVGWLMGVEEPWLVDEMVDGIQLLRRLLSTQSPADWTSQALGQALAKEPFARLYPWKKDHPVLHQWYLRLQYHQHLSLSRLILSATQMRKLGLSGNVLPWYPLLMAPLRFVYYSQRHLSASASQRLEREGRVLQRQMVRAVFAGAGREAGLLQPGEQHPAHL